MTNKSVQISVLVHEILIRKGEGFFIPCSSHLNDEKFSKYNSLARRVTNGVKRKKMFVATSCFENNSMTIMTSKQQGQSKNKIESFTA